MLKIHLSRIEIAKRKQYVKDALDISAPPSKETKILLEKYCNGKIN